MPVETRYVFLNKYLEIYLFLCQVVSFVHPLHTPSKPDFYNGGSAEIAQLPLQDEHLNVHLSMVRGFDSTHPDIQSCSTTSPLESVNMRRTAVCEFTVVKHVLKAMAFFECERTVVRTRTTVKSALTSPDQVHVTSLHGV